MDTAITKTTESLEGREPASLSIASKGIHTSKDFANLMCNLMSDLIDGSISPVVANAVCSAGGKLLKVVELEHKYGVYTQTGAKQLSLSGETPKAALAGA